jgi:hypothetical protein
VSGSAHGDQLGGFDDGRRHGTLREQLAGDEVEDPAVAEAGERPAHLGDTDGVLVTPEGADAPGVGERFAAGGPEAVGVDAERGHVEVGVGVVVPDGEEAGCAGHVLELVLAGHEFAEGLAVGHGERQLRQDLAGPDLTAVDRVLGVVDGESRDIRECWHAVVPAVWIDGAARSVAGADVEDVHSGVRVEQADGGHRHDVCFLRWEVVTYSSN